MRQWQTAVREHLENNAEKALPRHSWREGGRVALSEAAKQLQYDVKSGKINTDIKAKINLQMFAEHDLEKQSVASIRRGIKSLEENIVYHRHKIAEPWKYDKEWSTYPEYHQKGLIRHWEHEIKVSEQNIKNREEELRKRGE